MKGAKEQMDLKNASKLIGQFAMVEQLGLSLLMPLLMCIVACFLLNTKLGISALIYIPGFILGLGASMTTAYKVYLSVVRKEEKNKLKHGPGEVSFNRHV